MARTSSAIFINKSRETVFNYVTTAANWPSWHPASKSVSGDVDHSGEVGDRIIEQIRFMGQHERFTWTVRERRFPERWVFSGTGASGAEATITYTLTAQDQGTRFERELTYSMGNAFIRFLDRLIISRRMTAVSQAALTRLKQTLEGS